MPSVGSIETAETEPCDDVYARVAELEEELEKVKKLLVQADMVINYQIGIIAAFSAFSDKEIGTSWPANVSHKVEKYLGAV